MSCGRTLSLHRSGQSHRKETRAGSGVCRRRKQSESSEAESHTQAGCPPLAILRKTLGPQLPRSPPSPVGGVKGGGVNPQGFLEMCPKSTFHDVASWLEINPSRSVYTAETGFRDTACGFHFRKSRVKTFLSHCCSK